MKFPFFQETAGSVLLFFCLALFTFPAISSAQQKTGSVTVPIILDHNRMLVKAEIQRKDGSWRAALLWVDTGNPTFYMSESLAIDLGIDFTKTQNVNPDVSPPAGIRIGGLNLNIQGIKSKVMTVPHWLFSTMHNDGNLPSTVLKQYHVVFDYPGQRLTIAQPGYVQPRGLRVPASVHPATGIIQINAHIDGDSSSFAIDVGASYSFVSSEVLDRSSQRHKDWERVSGTAGCANMWGWWPPGEETMAVMRFPEISFGSIRLKGVALVGVPRIFPNHESLGEWYSRKSARPVEGFLGPNAFKAFRLEIDYPNSAVYFEKGNEPDVYDLDVVGIGMRQESDGRYTVIGIVKKSGKPVVEGVEPGDKLIAVNDLKTTGVTMGTVSNALRGKPGEFRILHLARDGKSFEIRAIIERIL